MNIKKIFEWPPPSLEFRKKEKNIWVSLTPEVLETIEDPARAMLPMWYEVRLPWEAPGVEAAVGLVDDFWVVSRPLYEK